MKWFILIGVLINVLLAGGIYVNHRLDQVVQSLNRPGLLFSDGQLQHPGAGEAGSGDVAQRLDDDIYWNGSWENGAGQSGSGTGAGVGPGAGTDAQGGGQPSGGKGDGLKQPSNTQIADDVAAQVGRPIEKADMIKAGLIVLKRLNGEEISYLYQVGRKGSMTATERVKVKKILSGKLTSDDAATLKALGKKYGKNLTVLD